MPGAGIIRNAGIIRGSALYEEIRYSPFLKFVVQSRHKFLVITVNKSTLMVRNETDYGIKLKANK